MAMEKKKLIAYINAENELAESILKKAESYERIGADELFIYNYSQNEGEREEFLLLNFLFQHQQLKTLF